MYELCKEWHWSLPVSVHIMNMTGSFKPIVLYLGYVPTLFSTGEIVSFVK